MRSQARSKALIAAAILMSWMGAASSSASVIKVTPADAPAIKQAIAKQEGHVVVLNFWATYCGPCCEEFPSLVKLSGSYSKRGLVVMAVSADIKSDLAGKVIPFLTRQKAYFPQFLQQSKDVDSFINAFDPTWQGDLPRTFIYDKHGRLAKVLKDEQTYASFVATVAPLLAAH